MSIGGHTVLVQRLGTFDAELERKAIRARERAKKAQASFDKNRKRKLGKQRAKLKALNQAISLPPCSADKAFSTSLRLASLSRNSLHRLPSFGASFSAFCSIQANRSS